MRHRLQPSLELITGREAAAANSDTSERVDTQPEPTATVAETPRAGPGHTGYRAPPGEQQPERVTSPSDSEEHRRWEQRFYAQEVRYLNGRVEELERQLRRRTVALVCALVLSGSLAALGATMGLLSDAEPVAHAHETVSPDASTAEARPEAKGDRRSPEIGALQPVEVRPLLPAPGPAGLTLIEQPAMAIEPEQGPAATSTADHGGGGAIEEHERSSGSDPVRPTKSIAKAMRERHERGMPVSSEGALTAQRGMGGVDREQQGATIGPAEAAAPSASRQTCLYRGSAGRTCVMFDR